MRDFALESFTLSVMWSIGQPLRSMRRLALRTVSVLLSAMAFGMGGGLGGLGSGTQQVGKPDRENPIVCVTEQANERH